jgi:hypothetical protein
MVDPIELAELLGWINSLGVRAASGAPVLP